MRSKRMRIGTLRKKRWLRSILSGLLVASMLLLTGCSGKPENIVVEEKETGIQIGISFDSFVIERWQRERDVFVSACQELGAEVNVQNANGDIKEQVEQIDYFIKKGMDAILVIQVADEAENLSSAISRAKKAGIPVICYDRMVLNADADLYISFDNEQVGRLMGEHMVEHMSQGDTMIQICGPLSDNNVSLVMKGFREALKDSGILIAQTDYAEGWVAELAVNVTNDYLETGQPLMGIMCGNDNLASYAAQALSERRMLGKVCLVGQDADLEACQRIVEGTQCMTVYKPVEKLAKRAAELTVKLAKGEKLDEVDHVMNNGTYDVPYEALEPIAVTKDNMDEIITGNYHEASDIYLNIQN